MNTYYNFGKHFENQYFIWVKGMDRIGLELLARKKFKILQSELFKGVKMANPFSITEINKPIYLPLRQFYINKRSYNPLIISVLNCLN